MNSPNSDMSYVDQLRQVFNSCDRSKTGLLNKDELQDLCENLQLDLMQTSFMLDHLAKDGLNSRVNFNEFKEVFVSLLTQTQNVKCEDLQQQLSNPSSPFKLSSSSSGHHLETEIEFSAKGTDGENGGAERGLNCSSMEQYLRTIWEKLNVGKDGYLNIEELYLVCEHIGMIEINDEVILQLFEKLDCDKDGKVSFDELLQLLFQQQLEQTKEKSVSPTKLSRLAVLEPRVVGETESENSSKRSSACLISPCRTGGQQAERQKANVENYSSTINYMMSFNATSNGYTDTENVTSLWESLGFSNPKAILKELGFNPNATKINVQNLTSILEDELSLFSSTASGASELFHVALATFQHELVQIKINYEQVKAERDKLRVSIAEANSRADLLAQEVDDHHAKLERSSQNKLMFLEKKYQEQMRTLEEELQREREVFASQSLRLKQEYEKELSLAQESQAKLKAFIDSLEMDSRRLEKECQEAGKRCAELLRANIDLEREVEESYNVKKRVAELESMQNLVREQEYQSLLQEIDFLKKQNKELQDENDQLMLEIEQTRQELERKQQRKNKSSATVKRIRSHRRNTQWGHDSPNKAHEKSSKQSGQSSSPFLPVKRRGNEDTASEEDVSEEENEPSDQSRSKRKTQMTPDFEGTKEMMNEEQPVMEVETDEVSTSLTLSCEADLLKEINDLKEKLRHEIEARDNLISQKDEISRNLQRVEREFRKRLQDEASSNEDLASTSQSSAHLSCSSSSSSSVKNQSVVISHLLQIFRLIYGWCDSKLDGGANNQSFEQQLNAIIDNFVDLYHRPSSGTASSSSDLEGKAVLKTESDQILCDLFFENTRLMKELQVKEEARRETQREHSSLIYRYKVLSKLLSDFTGTSTNG